MAAENRSIAHCITSLITLGFLLPLIFGGTDVSRGSGVYGLSYFLWHFIGLGISIRVVAVGGMVVLWRGMRKSILAYMVVKLVLMSFLLFIVVVTSTQEKQYWVKNCEGKEKWDSVVNNLRNAEVCAYNDDFSGCCEKPSSCGQYPSFAPDCSWWSHNITMLCYYCYSCRVDTYSKFKLVWRGAKPLLVYPAILEWPLIIVEIVFYVVNERFIPIRDLQVLRRHEDGKSTNSDNNSSHHFLRIFY
ncbi:hypothetical protein ACH5RR_006475 [Cinchona calisaya]|uniref:Uncharacterized protein n=1 Tax=Cinchona calisaya TaxID=153742 RepID=A0ABD3APH7_9GENT